MLSKVCFKCLHCKPLDAFYKHSAMADGRFNKCIECTKADVRQNRLSKIEYFKAYDRMRGNLPHRVQARAKYAQSTEGRLVMARAKQKWEESNAQRRKAQQIASNAIRDGRLERHPCFVCGAKAQAHHPDYDAPLAVAWLCSKHHAQTHKEHREWARQAA